MIRECVTWAVLGNFACFLSADTFLKNTRVSNIFNSMDQDVLSDLILVQTVYNLINSQMREVVTSTIVVGKEF